MNRLVVNRQLAALGCQADYAVDGRDAFALWQANTYDLLLSDCHMPNVDGFALTRLIREAESGGGRHTPIVALTANALVGESERCLAAGMDDYLAKPVTLKQMGAMLRRWLGAAEPVDEEGPPVADAGTPAIDATRIEEFFGDADPAFLAIVLEQFTDAWATSAGEIAKAVETRNAGLLGTAAHRAAGSAAAVCAAGLSETLKDLERAATEADWAAAERLAALLPAQAQATEHDLGALAAGTHRDGSG